ncbi:hypothetical protein LZ318_28965 [Saccharopolyspora indica]|uniref:hypothetical protein n=1 Tax=Saccharopolyspora indica TaxID=1229659 RepID=UPI0022EB6D36|nr:hypothetical protein [Saccharopolyspora indica]MDA3646284.1 hypothetical protein [Saccharopolyspora indica]
MEQGPAHRSRRFVLREHDSRRVFDIADRMGWPKIGETVRKGFRKKALHVAWEMAPGVRLSYLSDRRARTAYLVVTSETTADLLPYSARISEAGIDFLDPEELVSAVGGAAKPKDEGLALVRAGLGAPENPTKPYVHAFFEAMRSPSTQVRMSGITAMGYAEWPMFVELLDAVSVEDGDAEVREHARSMAAAFRKA